MIFKMICHLGDKRELESLLLNSSLDDIFYIDRERYRVTPHIEGDMCTIYVHGYHADTPIEILENEFMLQFKNVEQYCIETKGKHRKLLKWNGTEYRYLKFITENEMLNYRLKGEKRLIKLVFTGDVIL